MEGKWAHPTAEQQEEFLGHILDGKTRQEAAELVGSTSTRFRTFINGQRPDSLAFAERYMAALKESGHAPSPHAKEIRELEGAHLVHRLLDEYLMRAFDSERGKSGSSNRMLHNLSLLKAEDFKPLLEARVRHHHSGAVGLYAALPQIDTERWTLEEQEEFVKIEARRAELLAIASPGVERVAELPAPNRNGDEPIDAEYEEIELAG